MVNSGIYVDPTSGMEDGEMKILEVGNSDRKIESSVHDMRRRASSGVPDPPNSIKRSLEFDEEAVETRPSQIIDENVESPKHQSKKGREIAKVIETATALGLDFNGNEDLMAEIIKDREREDTDRL
ncbi:hypothetical protein Q3G72_006421 [Acer saccharum]|nr:hypothetical protein Q3G72_006421 [Acer saccharum]